jgi:hypothetical protein
MPKNIEKPHFQYFAITFFKTLQKYNNYPKAPNFIEENRPAAGDAAGQII